MTNDDLSKFVDTSDEWIQQRTGVKERRFSHVNTSDMAEIAGKHAIACAGLSPEDIDVVILLLVLQIALSPLQQLMYKKKLVL